ncbi:class I adenylate-forming enzyme family protein [Reyranella sp. CPCC 100927]|uniref:class I adenylate-forming enzyme family protein n=1 Tax=Reyranella sp. CPCC 100927 TaxID=2599616 RepID=UPI0011B47AAB|nr:AMP-binding protein [Reyranella sp. CPCC 100927]TWT03767.1 long-chain fatty acid--CoA ligase [Reyranella sp. CPCC 100927]
MSSQRLHADRSLAPRFCDAVSMLVEAGRSSGDRVALRCGAESLTYRQYLGAAGACARTLLDRGHGGKRIVVALPNSLHLNVVVFGVLSAGSEVCLINPAYSERELRLQLEDARPSLVISGPDSTLDPTLAAAVDADYLAVTALDYASSPATLPDVEIRPDTPAVLLYTGGTTGRSKGVARTHRDLMLTVEGMQVCWPARLAQETWLNIAPVFHVWGFLMGCIVPAYMQAELVIAPRYKPETLVELLAQHRITVFGGGPAPIYSGLLAATNFADHDLSSLHLCPCGGSPCPPDLLRAWRSRTGVPLLQAYGMTEVAPITVCVADVDPDDCSVGFPMPHLQVEVVDLETGSTLPPGTAGEVRVSGATVLHEYLNRPDETALAVRSGWFYTGDIGKFDPAGRLYLVDRKKDMLIVGGFNVFPTEIDGVLCSHPDVLEAATVGIPDTRKGEIPVSFVALQPGTATDIAALTSHCARLLVDYKRPRTITLVDSLPRTPAGKIDRRTLAARAVEAPPASQRLERVRERPYQR